MENINLIKKRIKSVNDITQMTSAMQLVSAAKMRRAKNMLDEAFPFFSLCEKSMLDICNSGLEIQNIFYEIPKKKVDEPWRIAYFVLSGEQGLAGSYNNNVVKATEEHIQNKIIDNTRKNMKTDYTLFVFGKIARERLARNGYNVDTNFKYEVGEPDFNMAHKIGTIIRNTFLSGQFDLVYLVYTKLGRANMMCPEIKRILPVDLKSARELAETDGVSDDNAEKRLEYFPNATDVFRFLIDTYINAICYGAMVEAYSSEQTARLEAMDNATKNAEDMKAKLLLISNRARQSKITSELTEIINGANQVDNL